MKIVIGSDHGGFDLKAELVDYLKKQRHNVIDAGCFSKESCDYPKYCGKAAVLVSEKRVDRGIFICKSGIGSSIAANKVKGIRAALCFNIAQARSSREHNNANMLILGALYTNPQTAKKMLLVWLNTEFSKGRHARRIREITRLEKQQI